MRSAKGKMSFIAVDGDRSCLFELLEDRRLRSLFKHYQQFTRAARCRVKYLVMDMNAAYDIGAVQGIIPINTATSRPMGQLFKALTH
nr:transposase [Limosilactobacillus reuteri]